MRRLMAAILLSVLSCLAFTAVTSGGSRASASVVPRRLIAYRWAVAQRGKPYIFGGIGPAGFDCSGLVYEAYRHAGYLGIPRTTYGQLAWGLSHVVIVSKANARRGDLAFYGSGHVELVVGPRYTYGAHHSGTVLGLTRISAFWHPTLYLHVIGSG